MKYGTRNSPALDPSKKSLFWLQTKSGWEAALKAKTYELGGNVASGSWKETCGPHAAVNCLMAILEDPKVVEIKTLGGWSPRVPDILMNWFQVPSTQAEISKVIPGMDFDKVFENEFMALYPTAVKAVFGLSCRYIQTHTFDDIVGFIKAGHSVQIVFIKPGHYVSVHAYDDFTDELIYVDPNDTPHVDGNWACVKLTRVAHDTNVKPWILVY